MSRAKVGALAALALLLLSASIPALCGWGGCSRHAARMSCHPAPTASPRLSDCCAAHPATPATADSQLAAAATPRVTLAIAPALIDPGAAAASPGDDLASRPTIALFTLHHSLLL